MKNPLSTHPITKTLAGAIALAGGTSAYGAVIIVTPPTDFTNAQGQPLAFTDWDIDGDGTVDFTFENKNDNSSYWALRADPKSGGAIVGYSGTYYNYASALSEGVSISGSNVSTTAAAVVLGSRFGDINYGGFAASIAPGTNAYVGFSFTNASGTHYGYMYLNVSQGLLDFTSAAYESTPGTAITAGAVPEPGSLAFLALGATGILGGAMKRRRQAA